ncbi:hypothetical protein KXV85_005572, partial [Aspergillus fumigatus]
AARRHRAAGGTRRLAEGAQARCGCPSRRDLRDHGDRRRSRDRDQFPLFDAPARLVHGQRHALHLCLLGRDLWRRRPGVCRRSVARSAQAVATDESLRLEQAPVRHGGDRPCDARRKAAAAMGWPEVLQRVRAQRIPQGHDDERAGAPLCRHQGRSRGAAVQ